VQDVTTAVRNRGLKMGYYYSLFEWFNTLYLEDPQTYISQIMYPQLYDLINTYQPDVLYADGEWMHDSDFWHTKDFLVWLFNKSPVRNNIAINDRWGSECRGKDGGFFVCEYSAFQNCPPNNETTHPWTAHLSIGYSFGYNRMEDSSVYNNATYFIHLLTAAVAYGGHLQLNVGPTSDGRIDPLQQKVLLDIGEWLGVNGDAIYKTTTWRQFSEPGGIVFYTQKQGEVYVISTKWPGLTLELTGVKAGSNTTVEMIGYSGKVNYKTSNGIFIIQVPQLTISELPCLHAWSFRLSGVD